MSPTTTTIAACLGCGATGHLLDADRLCWECAEEIATHRAAGHLAACEIIAAAVGAARPWLSRDDIHAAVDRALDAAGAASREEE